MTAHLDAQRALLAQQGSIISDDIRVRCAVEVVGRAEGLTEQFHAITPTRRIGHPAIVAVTVAARSELTAETTP